MGIVEKGPRQVAVNMRGDVGLMSFVGGCPFQIFSAAFPPPKDLAGIEIYSRAATILLQYKFGTASCGIILFWT